MISSIKKKDAEKLSAPTKQPASAKRTSLLERAFFGALTPSAKLAGKQDPPKVDEEQLEVTMDAPAAPPPPPNPSLLRRQQQRSLKQNDDQPSADEQQNNVVPFAMPAATAAAVAGRRGHDEENESLAFGPGLEDL